MSYKVHKKVTILHIILSERWKLLVSLWLAENHLNQHAADIWPFLKYDQIIENTRITTGKTALSMPWHSDCHRLKIQLCISAEWRSEGKKGKGILYLLVHRNVSDCLEENKEFHRENGLPDSSPERNISFFLHGNYPAVMPHFRYDSPNAAHLGSLPKPALGGVLPSPHSLQECVKQISSLKGFVL